MDSDLLQRERRKLQKRFDRIVSAPKKIIHSTSESVYYPALVHFWEYVNSTPMHSEALHVLASAWPAASEKAARILQGETLQGDNEAESTAIAYFVVKGCIERGGIRALTSIGSQYAPKGHLVENLEMFTDFFVEPLYVRADEALEDQRVVLSLVKRYKQKAEWFCRGLLFSNTEKDPTKGERVLATHLYEYLHDQGLSLSIEPSSASGQADLLADQSGQGRLVADAKIFNPDKSKGPAYIARGFKQLCLYAEDHNQPAGYLVIFNTSGRDVQFDVEESAIGTPFVVYNGKTIFLVMIDIYPHETSASKRGRLKPVVIAKKDLVGYGEKESPPNKTA